MMKIGNVQVKELIDCMEENIEKEYVDILEKIKEHPTYFENELMQKHHTWTELKELLKYRKNIIDWLPMDKNADVLEIMSGCGVLTQSLSTKVKSVTCLEISKTKGMINAHRNKQCDNVEIVVGDYTSFSSQNNKKFDYIVWVDGLVDYQSIAPDYESCKQLLQDMKPLLKEGGTIICATNNPFGMRYLAGYPDENTGYFFEGLSGFPNSKTKKGYTKDALITLFEEANYRDVECYYPYPDYVFPVAIYSDERLPQKGELWMNMCNFQRERLVLFDEERAYDNVIENNMFPQYSNSYLIKAER